MKIFNLLLILSLFSSRANAESINIDTCSHHTYFFRAGDDEESLRNEWLTITTEIAEQEIKSLSANYTRVDKLENADYLLSALANEYTYLPGGPGPGVKETKVYAGWVQFKEQKSGKIVFEKEIIREVLGYAVFKNLSVFMFPSGEKYLRRAFHRLDDKINCPDTLFP